MKLRHTIVSITLLAMLTPLGNAAFAQNTNTNNTNATSGANSSSSSGAVSGSSSNAQTGASNARGGNARASNALTINNPGVTSSTIGGGLNNTDRVTTSSQSNNNNANQSYGSQGVYGSQTLYSAPTVYVPSVVGGNPCTNGASIGGSVVGFGIAGGMSWTDEECNKRQWTALMYQAGERDLAREVACDKREVYDAAKRVGRPCSFRGNFEPKGTPTPGMPVATIVPVSSGPVPVMAPAPVAAPALVEQCMNRNGRIVPAGTPGASCGMVVAGS